MKDDSLLAASSSSEPSRSGSTGIQASSSRQFDSFWNFQLVVFQVPHGTGVEETLFSVPRHGFMTKGTPFEIMFSMPSEDLKNVEGTRPDIPIVLEGTTVEDFRSFLTVLYPQGVSPLTEDEEWLGALRLAHKWEFVEVRKKSIKALESYIQRRDAVKKLELGYRFLVGDWVRQGLLDVAMKNDLRFDQLMDRPYFFGQRSVAKIFYIQSKAWQKKAQGEFDASSTAFKDFVSDLVSSLFKEDIARSEFVPPQLP